LPVLIGASGWQYKHWRETFYPKGVPQKSWLEFYCQRFQIVELNNSFYRLPPPQTFAQWAERTPADFIMGVKASRYLTHIKRLKDPEEPVGRFMEHARHLGRKLGPVLVQLPPTLKKNVPDLKKTLGLFPKGVRVAVEFRHDSWWDDEVKETLEEAGAALSLADRGSTPISPLWNTTDWGYVRWHMGISNPIPCYSRKDMKTWAQRIADIWGPEPDVYAFFNNDPRACALRDAYVFAEELDRLGIPRTRVAPRDEITVDKRPEESDNN
jgi:uncharacterized protein YecE (DUF72 family)